MKKKKFNKKILRQTFHYYYYYFHLKITWFALLIHAIIAFLKY